MVYNVPKHSIIQKSPKTVIIKIIIIIIMIINVRAPKREKIKKLTNVLIYIYIIHRLIMTNNIKMLNMTWQLQPRLGYSILLIAVVVACGGDRSIAVVIAPAGEHRRSTQLEYRWQTG